MKNEALAFNFNRNRGDEGIRKWERIRTKFLTMDVIVGEDRFYRVNPSFQEYPKTWDCKTVNEKVGRNSEVHERVGHPVEMHTGFTHVRFNEVVHS